MQKHTRSICGNRVVVVAAALALSTSLSATSPAPITPDQDLLPLLFETLGGDNWHRNDDWLDPDVHWCDWYGVQCVESGIAGMVEFRRLELPENNLAGTLTPELAKLLLVDQAPKNELDLSGNAIAGKLVHFPARTVEVNLSGNLLTGPLPAFPVELLSETIVERLWLARNDFEGGVPAGWRRLQVGLLDLSDNRLETGHEYAFAAMHYVDKGFLRLNGNRFSGELTEDITSPRPYPRGETNIGAGLDICFNDFFVDDPDVRDWVAARHVGSPDFEQCLGRERLAVDASLSGSWYDPDRPGEGASLMILDNGAPLLYSFTFDTEGRQQWLFEVGEPGEHWLLWDPLNETRGRFAEGIAHKHGYTLMGPTARFRFDRVGEDALSVHRHYYDMDACGPWEEQYPFTPSLCFPPLISDRLEYQRLSRLAGTSCGNQSEFQQYSGAWYNPERSGEGFIIEILPDNQAVVYWFTYKPDNSGEQAWMIGQGELQFVPTVGAPPPGTVVDELYVETMSQPLGGRYGSYFDPDTIETVEWGQLEIGFTWDGHAMVSWESDLEGYGSGSYVLERLARPMLAECDTASGAPGLSN